ncbi:unnamed protein product [Schistocephalus solidus]|uniref:Reverse transcriptase domain-containing protein n=1 Tax=Schistocephalus solidus TaxID=70667 RepID=A0A183SRU8_SCHSO|nr:unnamed protein product [Schistocephalus solidus]
MARKAEEIKRFASGNDRKNVLATIKAVYGTPVKGTAPLLSADRITLLTEQGGAKDKSLRISKTPKSFISKRRRGTANAAINIEDSLLNIAGKCFARILLNRLDDHLEKGLLPERQCDFRRYRGTTDTIVTVNQQNEKCQEMRTHLYTTFVDLTKVFDPVNRERLWKSM